MKDFITNSIVGLGLLYLVDWLKISPTAILLCMIILVCISYSQAIGKMEQDFEKKLNTLDRRIKEVERS